MNRKKSYHSKNSTDSNLTLSDNNNINEKKNLQIKKLEKIFLEIL